MNTCCLKTQEHYTKFCAHVTAVATLDRDLVPVTNRYEVIESRMNSFMHGYVLDIPNSYAENVCVYFFLSLSLTLSLLISKFLFVYRIPFIRFVIDTFHALMYLCVSFFGLFARKKVNVGFYHFEFGFSSGSSRSYCRHFTLFLFCYFHFLFLVFFCRNIVGFVSCVQCTFNANNNLHQV